MEKRNPFVSSINVENVIAADERTKSKTVAVVYTSIPQVKNVDVQTQNSGNFQSKRPSESSTSFDQTLMPA